MQRRHLIASTFCALLDPALAEPVEPAPVFHVGDSWKFNTLTWIGDKIAQYSETIKEVRQDSLILTAVDADGRTRGSRRSPECDPIVGVPESFGSIGYLKFPMSVGSRWDVDYRTREGPTRVTREVVRREKVRVSAGEFEALAIESAGVWSNQAYHNDGQVIEAYWYAPAVKRIVKYEGRWWGKGGVSSVGRSIQQELKWELAEYKLA